MPEDSNQPSMRTPGNKIGLWAIWFGVGVIGYTLGALLVAVVLGNFLRMNPEHTPLVVSWSASFFLLFLVLLTAGYFVQRRLNRFDAYGIVLMVFISVVIWWIALGLLTHYNSANPIMDMVGYSRNGLVSCFGAFVGAFASKRH